MKKQLVYVALFLSLAVVAVSVVTLLKVYYDDQAYSRPVQEPVYQFFCGTPNLTETELLGKETYNIYCTACHGGRYAKDNRLINITQRFDPEFLVNFVQSEDKLIAKHDTLTATINKEGGANYTHKFKLTPDEIRAVFLYLEED